MRHSALCAILMAVATTATTLAQAQSEQRLAAIAQSFADRGLFSGAVLVARGEQLLLDRGWGLASQEWQVPNGPGVKYLLASVSKQFTAAAVLRLVDQGRLALDDKLSAHVPGLPAAWSAITVRQLMAHTSGLPNHTQADGLDKVRHQKMTPRELYASFRDAPLDFAPGSGWNYSNSGYVMLGILIEQLSGKSYAEFVHTELFKPLGMAGAGVAHSEVIVPQLASGYVNTGAALRPAAFLNMSVPYSAGAMYGTTGDLLKWQRGLYGGAVLSPSSLQAMTTPVRNQYALGLNVAPPGQPLAYGHSGGIDGFSTYLHYEPALKLTVAVLSNQESAAAPALALKLAAAAGGVVVVLPEERKLVSLPAAALARVEGSYRLKTEQTLWVHKRGDTLWARLGNQPWAELGAQSASSFYAPSVDAELRFDLPAEGPARAVTLPDLPGSPTAPRVALPLPSFAAQPIYLRGSMNQWSTRHRMAVGDDGLHRVSIELPAGAHELKVASEDWSAIDFGGADTAPPLTGQGRLALTGAGRNIALQLQRAARCAFTVDGRDIVQPRLEVSCLAR
jgi:CubicO group peptidase (beta-lactamase class C family)